MRPLGVFTFFFTTYHSENDIFFPIIIPVTNSNAPPCRSIYWFTVGMYTGALSKCRLLPAAVIQVKK
jgi:hypothetical protein